MQKLFLLLCVLTAGFIYSQNLVILSNKDKGPVAFATVTLLQKGQILSADYCNEAGSIKISTGNFDAINFSCLGYKEKTLPKNLVKDTIYLDEEAVQLQGVTLKAKRGSKTLQLGYKKKGDIFVAAKKGGEVVLYIANTSGVPSLIKSFVFNTMGSREYRMAFRLHFYKKSEGNAMPGEEIPTENIVQYITKKSGKKIETDVSAYGIVMPAEGVFAGIEWLACTDEAGNQLAADDSRWYSTAIYYNDADNKKCTFIRYRLSDMQWQQVQGKANASFGLNVVQ